MSSIPLRKIWATNIVVIDCRLSDKAKLVFQRLVDRKNSKTGDCFPSIKCLADDVGCSTRTIRSAIRELEHLGYVVVLRRRGPNGTNRYDVWLPTGKSEYQAAEIERREHRKSASPKPMKKPMKEPKRVSSQMELPKPLVAPNPTTGDTREELEKSVVAKLGDDGSAWAQLMAVAPSVLEQIARQLEDGTIDGDRAVNLVLQEIGADGS